MNRGFEEQKKLADEPSVHDNLPQPITFGLFRNMFGDRPVRDERRIDKESCNNAKLGNDN